jgi:arginyl-tRNA synthetase
MILKELLRVSIDAALERLAASGRLTPDAEAVYQIETPRLAQHGDFSCNVALLLAKANRCPPRDVAALLAVELNATPAIERCEVAGPGFLNFTLADEVVFDAVAQARTAGAGYGRSTAGAGQAVQVEFVSANPTGPLHVGHGRGAAIGSVLANLLEACGYAVHREYYVNDAGRQMDILALSVWLRHRMQSGVAEPYPVLAYQGGYVDDIARAFGAREDAASSAPSVQLPEGAGDDDARLDVAIACARAALGPAAFAALREFAMTVILDGIKRDLGAFGVAFDSWYSEQTLSDGGAIAEVLERLQRAGYVYEPDGARWFRSTAFGDEKDRVVERENGQTTYFASDIAYHADKFARGYAQVIDIWGADHHGYIPRVRAALAALELDPARLEVVLVQFASLVRGGAKVAMSTRSGEFVTLRELVDEVGVDAARFFYVMRRSDQHLEFDLDLATARSNENPVYYVQYAHARVQSVFRQLAERGLVRGADQSAWSAPLGLPAERAIAMQIAAFPATICAAAASREPHQLTQYLRDLAASFHGYYNAHKVLVDEPGLRDARLALLDAVRIVIANGLGILGIRAPDEM